MNVCMYMYVCLLYVYVNIVCAETVYFLYECVYVHVRMSTVCICEYCVQDKCYMEHIIYVFQYL